MRLLLITNVFPNPHQPNKGIFNLHMARALARDHEVQVISPISWVVEWREKLSGSNLMKPDRSETRERIRIHYPRFYYPPKVLRTQYGKFLWKSVTPTVRRLLREFTPDAVLGYWVHPDGEVAVGVARMIGAPAIVMSGGSEVLILARNEGRRRRLINVLNQADAIVAVGQDLKNKIVQFGIPGNKVHLVPRGVDGEQFSPGNKEEARRRLGISADVATLLWVGRMDPVKGLDVLLEACACLRYRGENFQLYLVGDGPLRKSLQRQCRHRELERIVHWVGSVEHSRLPDWYRAADLTLLPSRSEGVPNVLRESLACGTPFVASRVGGIPEIADGTGSCLVEPNDASALVDGILHLLRHGRENGKARSPSSTWAHSAQLLTNVLQPLVDRNFRRGTNWTANGSQSLVESEGKARPRFWRQAIKYALAASLPRQWFLTRGPSNSRSVCLTFDDGPHPEHTADLLNILKENQVPATFFVIGEKAELYPDLIRRMAAEGHVVGNHSFYHGHWARTPAWRLSDEVVKTRELLVQLLGSATPLFRPPGGKLTIAKLLRLWRDHQTVVLWNKDPKDFACNSPQELSAWFRNHPLKAGDLILLHDRLPFAAKILPKLIDQARKTNLQFVTVADWLA